MKNFIKFLLIAIMIVSIQLVVGVPTENDYGNVNAWFNKQSATVKNVKLKIDEPADIKVTVNSNISGHVFIKLTNPLVTEPYQVIEGTGFDSRIDNLGIAAGWSKTFNWKIKPNGAWTNGNAPINIVVNFYNLKNKDNKKIEFTIANPYILDEQYTGPKPLPSSTDTAPDTTAKPTPFPSALIALAALLAVWRRRRGMVIR